VDHDSLLALFRQLALASTPLIASGCGGGNGPFPVTCPTLETTVSVGSLQDAALPDGGEGDGGLADLCREALPFGNIHSCTLVTADGGRAVHVVYNNYCATGRRPEGLVSSAGLGGASVVGAWLADAALLEAASVDAFEILADELEAHGAPSRLVRAARASADDERRHARLIARLAVVAGARPRSVQISRRAPRDLETVARENAVEGCVREAFGAMLAWRQARLAADRAIRETMGPIAVDETRHAALSWEIDAWSRTRLSAAARRHVRDSRNEAVSFLLRDVAGGEPAALRVAAGLPSGREAVDMASALFTQLTNEG
jgi:hypothetical protein